MKATKGKADPKIVNELIIKKLGEIWELLSTQVS
jgi:aspartyl-tRNA(Asn)/glutamyl-tRNA(Gln) amidotransferase subunit B